MMQMALQQCIDSNLLLAVCNTHFFKNYLQYYTLKHHIVVLCPYCSLLMTPSDEYR